MTRAKKTKAAKQPAPEPKSYYVTEGNLLKAAREARGWDAKELGRRLDMRPGDIERIEMGFMPGPPEHATNVLKACSLPRGWKPGDSEYQGGSAYQPDTKSEPRPGYTGPPSVAVVAAIAAEGAKGDQVNRLHRPPAQCKCGGKRWVPTSLGFIEGDLTPRISWVCYQCGETYLDGKVFGEQLTPGCRLYGYYVQGLVMSRECVGGSAREAEVPDWRSLTGHEQMAWEFAACAPVVFNPVTGEEERRGDDEALAIVAHRESKPAQP